MYGLSFDKINLIIINCCEDTYAYLVATELNKVTMIMHFHP